MNKHLKENALVRLIIVALLGFGFSTTSYAQQLLECDGSVPYFIVDLSSNPDSMYVTPEIVRNGQCCSGANNENYVSFYVTLHPEVAMIEIGIMPGYADPQGSGFYNIIPGDTTTLDPCGIEYAGGQPACITGAGPHKITYHKPGSNKVKYYIKQIPRPLYPADDTTRIGCSLPFNIYGLDSISITSINSSTGNTTVGYYNNLLGCTDCSTPSFNPGLGTPLWIDYLICGTQQASTLCGVYQTCDTVRFYSRQPLTLTATPNPASFCVGDSVYIYGTGGGGDFNFSYVWYDNLDTVVSNTFDYYASVQGSYTLELLDGLVTPTCPSKKIPVTVIQGLIPVVNAGADKTVCATSPTVSIKGILTNADQGTWSNGTGTFNPSPDSLIATYTPSASEINAGFVELILTSTNAGNNCVNTSDTIVIYFSDTVKVNPSFTPLNCYGEITTVYANATGGMGPYTYMWTTGSPNSSITVPSGVYGVIATDSIGCSSDVGYASVSEPAPLVLSTGSSNTSTDIACDGTAWVEVAGGTGPYTYLWSNTETTDTTSSTLCWGIATVQVTDANGCMINGSVVVNKPSCASFDVTATNTDVLCYGDSNAVALAVATGGTSPYMYSWNTIPVQNTANASNLGAGAYTVTATDNNGCIDVYSVTVFQPTLLTNNMTHTNVTVLYGNDGTATANPLGGTPGYTYTWSPAPAAPQTTQTVNNLTSGIYYVNILDANSCSEVDSVMINEPPCTNFAIAVNPKNISCYGDSTGSAYLTISDGNPPYSISWSSGETDVMNVTDLPTGSYTVTVTDTTGCTTFTSFDITEPAPLSIGLVPTNVSCNGGTDGTIDLNVSGGVFPYTYQWFKGAINIGENQDMFGIGTGTYSVIVTDANGCSISGSVGITQPAKLGATYTYTDVVCNGDDNGSIDATITGGVMPYTYSWTGPTSYTNTTQDISGLAPGLYQLSVTDANGCTLSTQMQAYINEPDSVLIVQYTVPCPAPGVGTVTVSIDSLSGGSGEPYQISFNGGTDWLGSGIYSATLATDSTYLVIAMDNNGCTTPDTTSIVVDPNVMITAVAFNPCVAVGVTTVDITVTATGGDGGSYEVSTDGGSTFPNAAGVYTITLPIANSYNIVVRDSSGCESPAWPIVIPDQFDANAVLTAEVSCPGASDGSVDLTVTGGTAPYSYSWTGPSSYTATTQDISGLQAGTYDVTVTDDSSCVATTSIVVTTTPDVTNPVITSCGASGNQNVVSDAGVCTYTNSGTGWDATATDNCMVSTILADLTGATTASGLTSLGGVVFNLGTTTVTWTVTDGSGNISTCTFDVIVTDTQLPAISSCGASGNQNMVSDPGVCTYTNTGTGWDATATDNCTVSTVVYTLTGATTGTGTSLSGVTFNLGTTTVTWTVTDGSSNVSTCTFDVIVTDNELPAISSCGASGTQNTNADPGVCTYTNSGTGWDATATDNCTVASIVYSLTGATIGTGTSLNNQVFQPGTTTVTWTVTDGSGNISTCTFDVIVADNENPAIVTCGPGSNQNVNSDFGTCTYLHTGLAWDASATDNCTVSSLSYTLTGATTGTGTTLHNVSFNLGTTTVTWTVTDNSGNTDVCSFDVIVTDNQDPAITSCGTGNNINTVADPGVCTYTNSGTAWDAIASDNCTVSTLMYNLTGVTTGTGTSLSGVVFNLGVTTVTWTATDNSGNTDVCSFTVTITDNQLPAISSCGATGTQNVVADNGVCTYTNSGTGWDATATDNCSVSTITYNLTGATTGTGTSLNNVVFNLGSTTVTWTVTDGSGNTSTCSFNVIVTDDQDPAILTCGPGGTQNVVADNGICTYTHSGTAWNATASDNCSVSTIYYTLTGATTGVGTTLNGITFNLGTTTVTWTAVDGSGNTDVCSFNVVVTDDQLPAITNCGPSGNQTVNAQLGTCIYTYSGTGWNATATDNCTVSTITYALTGATTGTGSSLNGVSFNLGVTLVTWTVTDGSGNTSTCSFTVTVLDDQDPVISSCGASGTQNVNTNPGSCTYTQSGTGWDATASDNCSISSLMYVLTGATTGSGITLNGVVFNQGTTTVTWTVTDGSGNTDVCSFNVVVTDNELPVISNCVSNINVNNDNGSCGAIVTWIPPGYTDNCGATMTSNHNPGDFFPIGTTTVTYTVTDGSGNVSYCVFDVTVVDAQLPQITCQSNIESCNQLVSFGTPTASDNCGVSSVTQIAGLPSGSIFPVGTTTITFQATDINGNTNTCSFNVIIHPVPLLNVVATDISCFSFGDGSIDLTVTNGTSPYNYNWSNGATTQDINNLQAGTYNVTVTDVFGCMASTSATVNEPTQLTLAKQVSNVSCYGGSDGSINLTIGGGIIPYNFDWNTGATTEDLSGLSNGLYVVDVSDANGCTITNATIIVQPDSLELQAVITAATCNAPNGSIQTQVIGGTTPYSYQWSNGSTNANLTNVVSGTYSLILTDDHGCSLIYSDSIEAISTLTAQVYINDVLCFGDSTGSAIMDVQTGTAPYTYQWSNGDTGAKADELAAGSYTVTVSDAFGCVFGYNFNVQEPDSLYVNLTPFSYGTGYNVSVYGAQDGSIAAVAGGGVAPYSYDWGEYGQGPLAYNLGTGSYEVLVTDNNGCVVAATTRLLGPDPLEIPEGVSPNGDGDNDYFVVHGLEAYPNNDITIYNRWGNIVYETKAYDQMWEGQNNKGEALPDGTYFVVLNAYTSDDSKVTLTGYIDLRRN